MSTSELLSIEVEDITGQVRRRANGIALDATIAEMTDGLTWNLGLPEQDSEGRSIRWRVSADGQTLNPSERVGDVLKKDDCVTLSPSPTAG